MTSLPLPHHDLTHPSLTTSLATHAHHHATHHLRYTDDLVESYTLERAVRAMADPLVIAESDAVLTPLGRDELDELCAGKLH